MGWTLQTLYVMKTLITQLRQMLGIRSGRRVYQKKQPSDRIFPTRVFSRRLFANLRSLLKLLLRVRKHVLPEPSKAVFPNFQMSGV
jgi:hypothetical protein